jgi:hypothetical protein
MTKRNRRDHGMGSSSKSGEGDREGPFKSRKGKVKGAWNIGSCGGGDDFNSKRKSSSKEVTEVVASAKRLRLEGKVEAKESVVVEEEEGEADDDEGKVEAKESVVVEEEEGEADDDEEEEEAKEEGGGEKEGSKGSPSNGEE